MFSYLPSTFWQNTQGLVPALSQSQAIRTQSGAQHDFQFHHEPQASPVSHHHFTLPQIQFLAPASDDEDPPERVLPLTKEDKPATMQPVSGSNPTPGQAPKCSVKDPSKSKNVMVKEEPIEIKVPTQGGRKPGVSGYSEEEIEKLL